MAAAAGDDFDDLMNASDERENSGAASSSFSWLSFSPLAASSKRSQDESHGEFIVAQSASIAPEP